MRAFDLDKKEFHFLGMGLSVFIPDQHGVILPVVLSDDILGEIPGSTEEFTVIRYIGNLTIFRINTDEMAILTEPLRQFDPPIELRIRFTQIDLDETYGADLELAYWNMEEWVIISDEKHQFTIKEYDTHFVASVKIWNWTGDPTIAWGR